MNLIYKGQEVRQTKDFYQSDRCDIGDYSYGFIKIIGAHYLKKLTVGKFCSISSDVKAIFDQGHTPNWISTYPLFIAFPEVFDYTKSRENTLTLTIGNDVWIGEGAILMPSIVIGDGSILGANTVVTKDVPPYSVVVGNPGNVIKRRFAPEDIEFLLSIKWWNWNIEKILKYGNLLNSSNIRELRSILS